MTAATVHGSMGAGADSEQKHGEDRVEVHVDYISADEPIHRKFPAAATLLEVKTWARTQFVPNPPSNKTYYLSDDKTRRRFTTEEEALTLEQAGYKHEARLRLNEEQVSGQLSRETRGHRV